MFCKSLNGKCRIIIIIVLLAALSTGCAAEFYVAADGSDTNSGTKDAPFATLERARLAVRQLKYWNEKGLPSGGVTVYLRAGRYPITDTFVLDQIDSGMKDSPVVYQAYQDEEVRLVGGKEIESSAFNPVTDPAVLKRIDPAAQDTILQVDLKSQGITDFGQMRMRGLTQPVLPSAQELIYNDQVMQIARFPNAGYAEFEKIIDAGTTPRNNHWAEPSEKHNFEADRGGTFVYEGNRPDRWSGIEDVWLFGHWAWDWADETIEIKSIDTNKKQITLAAPHHYGMNSNKSYYALNILSEIDQPGEYYVDRKAGILYFWPPSPIKQGRVVVSMLEDPMIMMREVSHITLSGLILEATRGLGVYMTGGSSNLIAGCTFRNMGISAVCIGEGADGSRLGLSPWCVFSRLYNDTAWNRNGGTNNGVLSCDIYNMGAYGIILGGGDRKTLSPANNFAVNNHIHHFGLWYKKNFPGINVDGIGNRIANNLIHDGTHSAIMYYGNDHIFEYNQIHHCVTDSSDAGSIYTGRNPSARGNIIRHNFIHDIGPEKDRGYGAQGIFFDDSVSGQIVFGNVFYHAGTNGSVKYNGGYDNIVENNIFIDCPPSIIGKYWGDKRWKESIIEGALQKRRLTESVDITKAPYLTRYPKLASVFDKSPAVKRVNIDKNNYVTKDLSDFVEPEAMDFQLKKDAAVFSEIPGFKRIPFEKIGLYKDQYRTVIPEK